jgi:predicted deacylase
MRVSKYQGSGLKKVLVIAGVHGNELTPLLAVNILENNLQNVTEFYSELIVVNFANLNGIRFNTREIPDTSTNDLNRMFKSEEINVFETLKQLIDQADVVIDLHSSADCTDFVLINRDEYCNSYVNFCQSSKIQYVVRGNSNNTIKKYCIDNGKIGFTIELNRLDVIDANSAKNGARMVLRMLANIPSFQPTKENPTYANYFEYRYHKEGLFIPSGKKMGENVTNGDYLGTFICFDGKSEDVTYDGIDAKIVFGSGRSYSSPETCIYGLQPIENNIELVNQGI